LDLWSLKSSRSIPDKRACSRNPGQLIEHLGPDRAQGLGRASVAGAQRLVLVDPRVNLRISSGRSALITCWTICGIEPGSLKFEFIQIVVANRWPSSRLAIS
jgi:hypothetical protein